MESLENHYQFHEKNQAIRNKKVLGGIAGGIGVPTAVGVGRRLLGGAGAAGDALGHVGRRSAGR